MKLQVNQSNLLANIATVFTDKTKVVTELVQNARRAGASKVFLDYELSDDKKTVVSITIRDNGFGIKDFTKLFTLAESGWDAAVQSTERPYGMGFYATLTCARTVTIQSNGQQMVVDSAQALSGADIGEACEVDFFGGTKIELAGVDINTHFFTSFLHGAFLYSSIEIFINGKPVRRSLALCNMPTDKVFDTPFGRLVVEQWFVSATCVIVQEMHVGSFKASSDWSEPNVLFANTTIKARMPDRDSILNKEQVEAEFISWLSGFYREKLLSIRTEMSNDVLFVERYFEEVLTYCPQMLNEIDYLPDSAFRPACFPTYAGMQNDDSGKMTTGILRSSLARGEGFIAREAADLGNSEHVMAHFLYHSDASILTSNASINLPSDHWVHPFIQDLSEADFAVKVTTDAAPITIETKNVFRFTLLPCSSFVLTHTPSGKSVSVEAGSIYIGDSESTVDFGGAVSAVSVGAGSFSMESLLLKMSSYEDEYDAPLDDLLAADVQSATLQYKAATGVDVVTILSDLVGKLPESMQSVLAGKTFKATMMNGRMSFELFPLAA